VLVEPAVLELAEVETQVAYLAPGQLLATAEPVTVRTVLGSCVAVCLYDPLLRVGGMNHFLLPESRGGGEASFRYGDAAMEGLWRELARLGAGALGLRARVFGGARVLSGISDLMHLGERNVECALAWLGERRVPVVERHVLGSRARRIEFCVQDGAARIRLLGAA
jgi:chemotaxis protein CheD